MIQLREQPKEKRATLFRLICAALAHLHRGAFLVLTIASIAGAAEVPPELMREFRGAWVATVYNLDWPSKPGLSAAQQQAELRTILDGAADLKLNAIVLQVRPQCDALYASKREPWSPFLTGKMGQPPEPFYDPLEFAVNEAHARGLELHAWFNPFRALANAANPVSANHVSQIHPQWVRHYGTQLWLDPGEAAAREYVIQVILDVVRRYDIDGVHLDDYFYPYPTKDRAPFPDDASWSRDKAGGGALNRDDWRRDNINQFVSHLYRAIKGEKRWVKFGISPFGIWRPGVPSTIEAQLDSYAQLFADSRKWLNQGWCDYFAPQLYWSIEPPKQSFSVLLDWWRGENKNGRHLWPGIATDRIGVARKADEITRQIALTRHDARAPGHIHWSNKSLARNVGGVAELLRRGLYADLALVPASPWLGGSAPGKPLLAVHGGLATWQPGGDAVRWWLVQTKTGQSWRSRLLPRQERSVAVSDVISVRGVDRVGILGEPAISR